MDAWERRCRGDPAACSFGDTAEAAVRGGRSWGVASSKSGQDECTEEVDWSQASATACAGGCDPRPLAGHRSSGAKRLQRGEGQRWPEKPSLEASWHAQGPSWLDRTCQAGSLCPLTPPSPMLASCAACMHKLAATGRGLPMGADFRLPGLGHGPCIVLSLGPGGPAHALPAGPRGGPELPHGAAAHGARQEVFQGGVVPDVVQKCRTQAAALRTNASTP
eukprot:CAMPEP_0197941166 /NCGR_PEP_ID=MMETSP1439-20131203/122373_1 /TAXON_ID=66791 /ORGANISM="Gonyaulax spinifera, Strain CCMP409" /LENGTH=219 /DNA_ID=CAMNT_0043564355 /DNA_START=380 /DNA_END=1042 /DNA_ORIENTATION=+